MTERILYAAIRRGPPHAFTAVFLPRPFRHHHIINMLGQTEKWPIHGNQGFITSNGEFVGRWEALQIAIGAGQLPKEHALRPGLFSEDLW